MSHCTIDGCLNQGQLKRGFCRSHYWRLMKYGDPQAGGTPLGTLKKWLTDKALTAEPEECVIWPFNARTHDGYGHITLEGKGHRVHRLVCQLAHGDPPNATYDAAHSCGVRLCVNPHHLRWATRKENIADCKVHGTVNYGRRNGSVKLSEAEVLKIRSAKGTQEVIAAQFGVSRSLVGLVRRGVIWGWL